MNKRNIIIFGGSGFIGRHLAAHLQRSGHRLTLISRHPKPHADGTTKFAANVLALNEQALADLLHQQDVVINCVGVLRSRTTEQLFALHADWPQRLYAVCQQQATPPKVIHFSALGSGESSSHYHRSKAAGEAALFGSTLDFHILRPSLIYGEDGASTRLYRQLARLARTPVLWQGRQRVQPIHTDDVNEAVGQLLEGVPAPRVIRLVGPRPIRMNHYLSLLRGANSPPMRTVNLPDTLTGLLARFGDLLPTSPLCKDTWNMLRQHNVADPTTITQLLGRAPTGAETFTQEPPWNT